jgi:hypothetical protein
LIRINIAQTLVVHINMLAHTISFSHVADKPQAPIPGPKNQKVVGAALPPLSAQKLCPRSFVAALSQINMEGRSNPYNHCCDVHDLANAPAVRRRNLRTYLSAIEQLGDIIWMGRDLGYRGGRRTGLALTDECRLNAVAHSRPGAHPAKPHEAKWLQSEPPQKSGQY